MDDLPQPLTPADCDLRDFQYMPLDVQRLCDSDLAALESPEACWSALLLWSKAWHQVPAASLPDDDRVLAKFTGYQRAPDAWLAIREGALRGWIKCSDGRLYHPVVAEKANEAWFAKHRLAHDKLCERIRKRNKQRVENGLSPLEVPELEQWIDMGRPLERVLFPSEFRTPSTGNKNSSTGKKQEFRRNDEEIPAENALKGKGTEGIGNGEGEVKNHRHSDDGGSTRASVEKNAESPPVSGAKYSTLLIRWERERKKLIRCSSAEPVFIEWLTMGVTDEQVRLAYEMAVARREADSDPSPLNVGLVNSCLLQVLNPHKPKVREDHSWKRSNPGIERKASELGIVCPPGKDHHWLLEKCESVIRQRANAQPQGAAA